MNNILTEEGKKKLDNYMENLITLLLDSKVPFRSRVMGFPILEISNRDELYGRIQMIKEILKAQEYKENKKEVAI